MVRGKRGLAAEGEEFFEQLGEIIAAPRRARAAQGQCGAAVRTRRAPQAEVDPARMQRLQRAKRLDDAQRRVVGQHDAAAAHTHPRRSIREVAQEYLGGRTHYSWAGYGVRSPNSGCSRGRRRGARGPRNYGAPAHRSNRRSAARDRARKAGKFMSSISHHLARAVAWAAFARVLAQSAAWPPRCVARAEVRLIFHQEVRRFRNERNFCLERHGWSAKAMKG